MGSARTRPSDPSSEYCARTRTTFWVCVSFSYVSPDFRVARRFAHHLRSHVGALGRFFCATAIWDISNRNWRKPNMMCVMATASTAQKWKAVGSFFRSDGAMYFIRGIMEYRY